MGQQPSTHMHVHVTHMTCACACACIAPYVYVYLCTCACACSVCTVHGVQAVAGQRPSREGRVVGLLHGPVAGAEGVRRGGEM